MEIVISHNIVRIYKNQPGTKQFIKEYLTKYEEVKKIDPYNRTKSKKFKIVKELRKLYIEDEDYVYFSRGVLSVIPNIEEVGTLIYEEEDRLNPPKIDKDKIRKSNKNFELRDDQVLAVTKCLVNKRGIIQMPTATGKSAIITGVIRTLIESNPDIKILALAPTLSTVENLNSTLVANGIDSKIFRSEISSTVTSALVQTLLSKMKSGKDVLGEIDAVFYDECLPSNAMILLSDYTYKSIVEIYEDSDIKEVMSYNLDTNQYEVKRILKKYCTTYNDRFWKVYYKDPLTDELEGISLTPNHKVYTKDRGYIPAEDLTENDFIKIDLPVIRDTPFLNSMSFVKVVRVSKNIGGKAKYKYNLEVEDNHNYFASNVLVSNCHHLKCDTWNMLNSLLHNVEYALGFSALSIDKSEIYLRDIRDMSYQTSLIVSSTGPVIMHMDPSYYLEKGIIALPVVFRVEHNINLPTGFDETNYTSLVKQALLEDTRQRKVARVAQIFSKYGRKVLILVTEKEQGFQIARYLNTFATYSYGISYGGNQGFLYNPKIEDFVKVNSMEVLRMLSEGKLNVVIGSTHVDEGVDLSFLDCVILAGGGKNNRRIIQRIGRVLRKSKTGKYAYVVDFTDQGSRVLAKHSRERLSLYKDLIGVPENNIYKKINITEIEKTFKLREGIK